MGTILKCDRPNESRCCSISFDPIDSSVILKGTAEAEAAAKKVAEKSMERDFHDDDDDTEFTTISNESDTNYDLSNEFIESSDIISSNDIDIAPSSAEEPPTTIEPEVIRVNNDDETKDTDKGKEEKVEEEQQRRNEIQRIYANSDFNGTNPSYLQIINNSPTLLVYATHGDGMNLNAIESTENPIEENSTEINIIDMNEIDVSTPNSSIENQTMTNIVEFVSTKEHDTVTDVHHGIKRNSIYYDRDETRKLTRTPEYYGNEGEYDETDGKPNDSDQYSVDNNEKERKTQSLTVNSLLKTVQKQSGAARNPINNRFGTLQQMVDNNPKQQSSTGQARVKSNYSFRPSITTTSTTTTTESSLKKSKVDNQIAKRKYLQRPLPAAIQSSTIAKSRITTTTTTTTTTMKTPSQSLNLYSRARLRTKSTKKPEHEQESLPSIDDQVNVSILKPAYEIRDSEELQTALLKRSQLFSTKRRNILNRVATSPSDSETQTQMPTVMTTPPFVAIPIETQEIDSDAEISSERIASRRKSNRNSAYHHRFRVRPDDDVDDDDE